MLLHVAGNGRAAPALARLMLWLGIGATGGANVAYGAGFGPIGALISAWPAVAFIGAVEMVMQLVRRARGPSPVHRRGQPCQAMWSRRSAPMPRRSPRERH